MGKNASYLYLSTDVSTQNQLKTQFTTSCLLRYSTKPYLQCDTWHETNSCSQVLCEASNCLTHA